MTSGPNPGLPGRAAAAEEGSAATSATVAAAATPTTHMRSRPRREADRVPILILLAESSPLALRPAAGGGRAASPADAADAGYPGWPAAKRRTRSFSPFLPSRPAAGRRTRTGEPRSTTGL